MNAEQTNLPGVRPNQSEQHANRRRLAGAVRTKKPVNTRRRHRQIQSIYGGARPKPAGQFTGLDQIVHLFLPLINVRQLERLTVKPSRSEVHKPIACGVSLAYAFTAIRIDSGDLSVRGRCAA